MKQLNGSELAGFIKERQSRQVAGLISSGSKPKLAIVQTSDNPVINTYVRLKKAYGQDIGIDVESYNVDQSEVKQLLNRLNSDNEVTSIIVQLPLSDPSETNAILNLVDPHKDVDGLGQNATFIPATPMAISWLLSGYNIDLKDKKIVIIGKGRLVGSPLSKLFHESNLNVGVFDKDDGELAVKLSEADVIISATGKPGLIKSEYIPGGSVVVDAGVAVDSGKTSGDLALDVYDREDIIVTPVKGGVGPLTVCALFENVITASS